MAHECAACEEEVWTSGVETFVNEEVFLFPAEVCHDFLHVGVEVVANVYGCLVYGAESLEERLLQLTL